MGYDKLKCHKAHCLEILFFSFLSFLLFFLINVPWIAVSLWLVSRVLEKLIGTIFARVLIVLMEDEVLRSLYSTLSQVLSLSPKTLKSKNFKCTAQTKESVDWDGLWAISLWYLAPKISTLTILIICTNLKHLRGDKQ